MAKPKDADVMIYVTKAGKFRARIRETHKPLREITIGNIDWLQGNDNEYSDIIYNKIEIFYNKIHTEKERLVRKNQKKQK